MRGQSGISDAQLAQMFRDFTRIKEKVQLLTGDRGAENSPMASVRREDFVPIAELANPMKSAQVTSSPTAADYNNLQKDVANIYAALVQVANLLGNRTA